MQRAPMELGPMSTNIRPLSLQETHVADRGMTHCPRFLLVASRPDPLKRRCERRRVLRPVSMAMEQWSNGVGNDSPGTTRQRAAPRPASFRAQSRLQADTNSLMWRPPPTSTEQHSTCRCTAASLKLQELQTDCRFKQASAGSQRWCNKARPSIPLLLRSLLL